MRPACLAMFLGMLLVGCAPAPPPAPEEAGLSPPDAARLIRQADEFGKAIFIEVWAAEGPTARSLIEMGLLARQDGGLALTPAATRLGAHRDFFQDDVPVFFFPVGRRELVEILTIEDTPMNASKKVDFRYRRSLTDLGRRLRDAGSRLDELAARRVLAGQALVLHDDGWQVGLLQL